MSYKFCVLNIMVLEYNNQNSNSPLKWPKSELINNHSIIQERLKCLANRETLSFLRRILGIFVVYFKQWLSVVMPFSRCFAISVIVMCSMSIRGQLSPCYWLACFSLKQYVSLLGLDRDISRERSAELYTI